VITKLGPLTLNVKCGKTLHQRTQNGSSTVIQPRVYSIKHGTILTLQPSRKDPAFLASLKSSFSNVSEYLDAPERNYTS
jgi:hypothetical protein